MWNAHSDAEALHQRTALNAASLRCRSKELSPVLVVIIAITMNDDGGNVNVNGTGTGI